MKGVKLLVIGLVLVVFIPFSGSSASADSENVELVGMDLTESASAYGVYVAGGFAYVIGEPGLRVIDVSDPEKPRELGHCDTPGNRVHVVGKYAYVADGESHSDYRYIQSREPQSSRIL